MAGIQYVRHILESLVMNERDAERDVPRHSMRGMGRAERVPRAVNEPAPDEPLRDDTVSEVTDRASSDSRPTPESEPETADAHRDGSVHPESEDTSEEPGHDGPPLAEDAPHARRPSAGEAWRWIRDQRPLVGVAGAMSDGITNVLTALGARPVLIASPEEATSILSGMHALIIDAAVTLSGRWGSPLASARARGGAPPVVLIATLVDRSPARLNEARRLVAEARPAIIRGSVTELAALVGMEDPDRDGPVSAASVAQVVANRTGAVAVAWTSAEVAVADGRTMRSAPQGGTHSQRGMAASALDATIAATLACGAEPLAAARAATTILAEAMRAASVHGVGPGSFASALLDVLAGDEGAAAAERPPGASTAIEPAFRPDEPSVRTVAAPSAEALFTLVDGVANRIEGGRVVPGAVPLHLLRRELPTVDTSAAVESWARVVVLDVRADNEVRSMGSGDGVDAIATAMNRAVTLGATAIVVAIRDVDDEAGLVAAEHAVDVAHELGLMVAIQARVDLAVAARADAVWISLADRSVPIRAAALIADGRLVVAASVGSIEQGLAAARDGAQVLAVDVGSTLDPVALAAASQCVVARLIEAEEPIDPNPSANGDQIDRDHPRPE